MRRKIRDLISFLVRKTGTPRRTSMAETTRRPRRISMLRMIGGIERDVMMKNAERSAQGPETTRKFQRMLEIEIDLTEREIPRGPKIHHASQLQLPKRLSQLPLKMLQGLPSQSKRT